MTASMPAGRDLDLLVAQKIFGYGRQINAPGPTFGDIPAGCHRDRPVVDDKGDLVFLRQYSTDISAAWEVVEKMRKCWFMFNCEETSENEYSVEFMQTKGIEA